MSQGTVIVAAIAAVVASGVGAHWIGLLKKLGPGTAWWGVLLGVFGLGYVAARRPTPDAIEAFGTDDRWAWARPTSPAFSRHAAGAAALAVIGTLVVGYGIVSGWAAALPGDRYASVIESTLQDRGIDGAFVSCPSSVPSRSGYIFDCSATVANRDVTIRVTEDDRSGHFHWEQETMLP